MAFQIELFFAFLLVAGCSCAPHEFGGGFRAGAQSRSDVTLGGTGKVTRDGLLLAGETSGLAGAKWAGTAYGGGYADLDDLHVAGRGAVNSKLAGTLEAGANGKFGLDEDMNVPFGLQGNFGSFKQAEIGANGVGGTGDDGSRLSKLYRNSGFDNPHTKF